jgi:hypothetical protein
VFNTVIKVVASLLFAGLLINADSLPRGLRWLNQVSFFHAAFEALAVNELRTLQLSETKVDVSPLYEPLCNFPLAVWCCHRRALRCHITDVWSQSLGMSYELTLVYF